MLQPEPRVSFKPFNQTGADVNYTDTTCNFPLLFAVARGDACMVKLLCDAVVAKDQVTDSVAKGGAIHCPPPRARDVVLAPHPPQPWVSHQAKSIANEEKATERIWMRVFTAYSECAVQRNAPHPRPVQTSARLVRLASNDSYIRAAESSHHNTQRP
jgi:hypothetical protein